MLCVVAVAALCGVIQSCIAVAVLDIPWLLPAVLLIGACACLHAAGVVAVLLADACARWWPAPSPPVLARLAVGYASLSWAAGIAGPVLAVAVGAVNTVAANGASNKGSLVNKAAVRAFRWGCSGVAVGHAALCVYVLSSSGLLTVLDAVAAAKKDDDGAGAVRAGKPAARPPPRPDVGRLALLLQVGNAAACIAYAVMYERAASGRLANIPLALWEVWSGEHDGA